VIPITYTWKHLHTGYIGVRTREYLTVQDFINDMERWNAQQPERWSYQLLVVWPRSHPQKIR
jgi:hypothetical protein